MNDSSDHDSDRRGGKRYPLALPLQFENRSGVTYNVSSAGVLFATAQPPCVGERLQCRLQLADGTSMHFEAVVVRVEERREAVTVAARFDALSGFESLKDVR